MKTLHALLRERLLGKAGLLDVTSPKFKLSDLSKSEWSAQFERLMRNRLIMGALRYGPLSAAGKPQYDRVASILNRIESYQQTGNQELLVDIANLALVEFVEGAHPKKHFAASDDGQHVKTQ